MDQQAGAPPDNFAVSGQNWGFPTYNWEEMEKDGFGWWRQRFGQMSNYFDGFRIDHILGFFRIWSIPMDAVQGILGHFSPAIPVYRSEFNERNIWFDHDRYTKPFINDAVLWEVFGPDSELVKTAYLEGQGDAFYTLKDEFRTQRKVEAHFAAGPQSAANDRIRDGLYDLIANVILLDVEGAGRGFHFRIAMESTSSFRYLEYNTQQQLKDLYINYFFSRQDEFWRKEAMHKLPALKRATDMLVFGEDLGMVPRCVPEVMRQLGILSLEIQRMPKNPAREFFHPGEAPYLSVVTPSTHDMSTIRGWWEEDREATQRFFNREMEQWGEAPLFCEPWINKAVVLQHLHSPAMWSIFQLQDIMGMSEVFRRENPHDERINIPADPHHYWRYRMHLSIEELMKEKAFNEELKDYVTASGR
jgi:4-alpha-glucanotransferase